MPYKVRFTKEDEDCLNACCSGMLEACDVSNVEVDVIIYIHQVRCGDWVAIGVEDTRVYTIFDSPCETGCRSSLKRATPLYLVENGLVFQYKRGIVEEFVG